MKPTFSKSGVATFTFDEAESYPLNKVGLPNQSIGKATGGAIQVRTYTTNIDNIYSLNFRLNSLSSYDNLYNFFNDSNVNWRANTVTYTDYLGNLYTVRLWQDGIPYSQVAPNIILISLTLRIEP